MRSVYHSMRRILHLRTVTGRGGGPEKTILNSPRYIGAGYDMRLAYFRPRNDPEYDMPERAQRLGVNLVDIPESGPLDPRAVRRLAAEIRAYRPDILHAHDYKTNLLSVVLGKWFGIPAVTTMHGYVERSRRLGAYYLVDRLSLKRMRHIVAVSEDLRQLLADWGIPSDRCSLVHNAIDAEAFRRERSAADAKASLGLAPERFVVGAVGRLAEEKGFDLLIRVVDRLIDEGHQLELAIVGEGADRPRLEQVIAAARHPERLRLLGYRSDTQTVYTAFDVFVLSSVREGLPNVLLEAMAMETPVVATRVAGVPQVIEDGASGLLVDIGSAEQLAAAIGRLASDGELRRRLSAAARRTVEERFSFARRMEKIRAIYDRVLGG